MTTIAATSVSNLAGLFKQVYPDGGPVDAIPKVSILQKNIKFDSADMLGDSYNFPVVVTQEAGVSYGGNGGTAFSINPAISMTTQNAQVKGSAMIVNGVLAYQAASRAVKAGKAAFASATSLQMANMIDSHSKRREIELLYGASTSGLASGSAANVNTTTFTFTPDAGQWSYLWVATQNATLDAYKAGSQLNTNASLVVSKVNVSAKTLTITGNATDVTAIDTAATGVILYFQGAFGNEAIGLDVIVSNTSATLFNINAASYDLWQGNVQAVGGNLTYEIIGLGIAQAQGRGLDEDTDLLVSSKTWKYLNDNVLDNRRYVNNSDDKSAQTGSQELAYNTQSGVMRVHSHNYVKEGDAFLLAFDTFHRVGSSEITFNTPGYGGEIFRQLDAQAGFEYRTFSEWAVICDRPAKNVKFTGITNS